LRPKTMPAITHAISTPNHLTKFDIISDSTSIEGSNAEVGQVIAGIKFGSFLTPDMASKNDGRHGID